MHRQRQLFATMMAKSTEQNSNDEMKNAELVANEYHPNIQPIKVDRPVTVRTYVQQPQQQVQWTNTFTVNR